MAASSSPFYRGGDWGVSYPSLHSWQVAGKLCCPEVQLCLFDSRVWPISLSSQASKGPPRGGPLGASPSHRPPTPCQEDSVLYCCAHHSPGPFLNFWRAPQPWSFSQFLLLSHHAVCLVFGSLTPHYHSNKHSRWKVWKTETSHCDVIDLFPYPPVPPQTCGFWRGELGPSPEQERGGSLPPTTTLQILDWFVNAAPSDIYQSRRLGRQARCLPPLVLPAFRDELLSAPHFLDKDTEAQEHSLSKILHHLVSVLVAVSSLASPGEAFPGLK